MAKATAPFRSSRDAVPAIALVLAFVSSGAWMIVRLPPIPVSKALQLGTAGLWALGFALGWLAYTRPDRRVLWGLGAVLTAITASLLAGGSVVSVVLYDLFSQMPLVQWLAFPLVFVLAAGLVIRRSSIQTGLTIIVGLGVVLVTTIAVLQYYTNAYGVFGSSAYSTTALTPLIPVASALAVSRTGWQRTALYGAAAYIAVVLGLFAGSTMATVAAVFSVAVTIAAHPFVAPTATREGALALRLVRSGSLAVAGILAVGLLFAQVPVLSGSIVNDDSLGRFDKNIVSRAYLWQGAQSMVAERPVLGFGPSGYRVNAVRYLPPETLQFGPDLAGNIDPTVYSPQSPHSVVWEIATRLGVVGLIAFGALFVLWGIVLAEKVRVRETPAAELRVGLGAGFVVALFALLVNPVLFAIGLFPAVAAGLAVAPEFDADTRKLKPSPSWVRPLCLVVGVLVVSMAVWLGVGESRAALAQSDDVSASIVAYGKVLGILPGHPMTQRKLLESRLLVAADQNQVAAAQTAVDQAPGYMLDYAPNAVNFAAHSMAQAERTARTNLSWEKRTLDAAAAVLPPLPSLVAERLHLAVLMGDSAAVNEAMPAAREWGGPYPYTESYLKAAEQILAR